MPRSHETDSRIHYKSPPTATKRGTILIYFGYNSSPCIPDDVTLTGHVHQMSTFHKLESDCGAIFSTFNCKLWLNNARLLNDDVTTIELSFW